MAHHASHHIQKRTVSPFCNSILLRSTRHSILSLNPTFLKVSGERSWVSSSLVKSAIILTSSIRSHTFDLLAYFQFNSSLKGFEGIQRTGFFLKKVYPSKSRKVVYEGDEVPISTHSSRCNRSTQISMDEF